MARTTPIQSQDRYQQRPLQGLIFFSFVAKNGPFKEIKQEASSQILLNDAGTFEIYKKQNGYYPNNLDELREKGYKVFGIDHYLKPFYYRVSDDKQSYELRSLGADGEYGTNDDIFPSVK